MINDESRNPKSKILIRSVVVNDGKETVIEEYLDERTPHNVSGENSIITQQELEDIFDELFPIKPD